MNILKNILATLKQPRNATITIAAVICVVLATLSYHLVSASPEQQLRAEVTPTAKVVPTPTPTLATPTKVNVKPTPTPLILPGQDRSKILGIAGEPGTNYASIPWIRLSHPSCGWGNLRGNVLKKTIQDYHHKGVRILFSICQSNSASLYDTAKFDDAASAYPDAVQCGNEQMKQDASVSFLYVPPDKFAKFYDLCERAIHKVRPSTPVILGSLDPHVAGADYQLLVNQASYLDQMQAAMNSSVHPGGNWNWRNQIIGLIDSWHNGWAGADNLNGLFDFWSQQFQLDKGQLGNHLWVIEGTGCFKGCGINTDSAYELAVSHILTLISDVNVARQYKVPFFYFSGRDFKDQGLVWPIGILDLQGRPKAIRQDLAPQARTLNLTCGNKTVNVSDQLQLLSRLYSGCALPDNYINILSS
ncbi:hypothetical protein KDA_24850 [Dictyobacter alpinus]|uniref:Glycoside hydrolase family 42 N-terminal domain-containing protein n=1 Tax=Dictyobacter alpinus TaxID=2014873 RepID=A0A402B6L9_9CHLR|nr:hypothetical protein [Dictyobacter alpinus]GCE27001.1 hypothetical protein KDA_24850 [Dictyobacter alpinus]